MRRYEVTHRLGVRIAGLGSRPMGGVFEVGDAKADALRLDDNPNLKRIEETKRASQTRKPAADDAPDTEEA